MKIEQILNQEALDNLKFLIVSEPDVASEVLDNLSGVVAELKHRLDKQKLTYFRTSYYNSVLAEIHNTGYPYFCLPTDSFLTEELPYLYESLFVVTIKNWAYFIGINFKGQKPCLVFSRMDNSSNSIEELGTNFNFTEFLTENGFDEKFVVE